MSDRPPLTPQEPAINLTPGTQIGEYVISRVLGMGGFGITYLARDSHLDKDVAIKEYFPGTVAHRDTELKVHPRTLLSTHADIYQWGLERVMDEARVLAKFDHPNLVRVLRYFEAHGTAYIVMDFVAGDCLREVIERRGRTEPAVVKGWLNALLDGLAEVHRAGILHRDIKPGNIIIKADGIPVLIDFGAARQAMGSRSRDVTIVQSIRYTPIEQLGSSGTLGPWTDIYALAATMYEALTGQQPFDCSDRIVNDRNIGLHEALGLTEQSAFLEAIEWGLAVRPEDRPQSVAAWRSAITAIDPEPRSRVTHGKGSTVLMPQSLRPVSERTAADEPTQIKSATPAPTQRKPLRVGRWITALTLLMVVAGGAWFYLNESDQAKLTRAAPTDAPLASTQLEINASADTDPTEQITAVAQSAPSKPTKQEQADFERAEYIGVAAAYELFLRLHPSGFYKPQAEARLQ